MPPSVQSAPPQMQQVQPQPMQDVVGRQPAASAASGDVIERRLAVGGVTERAPPAPKLSAIGGVVDRNPADNAAPEPPQPPKKVSRFKAARQGL